MLRRGPQCRFPLPSLFPTRDLLHTTLFGQNLRGCSNKSLYHFRPYLEGTEVAVRYGNHNSDAHEALKKPQ